MKVVTTLLTLAFATALSTPAQADEHCDAQARALAVKADSDIFPGMSAGQRSELRKLAEDICEQYSAINTTHTASEADGDWFSDRVLNGEPADKPGNRRLERLGR